jgi:glucokinase
VVLDGTLYRGTFGIAAEFGHVRVVVDGLPCGCGDNGCWEQYASGKALVREARAAAKRDPASVRQLLKLAGGDPAAIDGPLVTQAAQEGDPGAVEAFTTVGTWFGRGLADLVAGWDPTAIVLGGGVVDAGDLLLEPARAEYAEVLRRRRRFRAADLIPAALGNKAGLVGAADLARHR